MALGDGGAVLGEGLGPALSGDFRRLRQAVDRFCQRPEEAFLPHEIGLSMEHLAQSVAMLNREFARLAGIFSRTGEAEAQGSNGDVEWVRHHCNLSSGDANARVVVGQYLDRLPGGSAALDEGKVGFGHLVQMARNARFSERSASAQFGPEEARPGSTT